MVYMGSKSRIVKYIIPILQRCIDEHNIECYVEPFVGGANVIDKINCKKRVGYDINKYLIELLKYTQANYKKEDCFPEFISKEHYDKVKESLKNNINEFSDIEKGIVGFLVSYGGKFFDGYSCLLKKNDIICRNYYNERKNNLLKQATNLQGIEFIVQEYQQLACDIENALIYCDPPYKDTKKYISGKINYEEFWQWVRKISLNNYVFVSSEQAPYDFITVWERGNIQRSLRNIDGKVSKTEKLFVYNNGLLKDL